MREREPSCNILTSTMAVCAFCLVQLEVLPDDATFAFFSPLLSPSRLLFSSGLRPYTSEL